VVIIIINSFTNLPIKGEYSKFIWEIVDNSGTIHKEHKAIADEAVKYFKNFFKPSINDITEEQVRVANQYPKMLDINEAKELYKHVTLIELEAILKLFKKEKSPGPNGWSVELYLHFLRLWVEIFQEWKEIERIVQLLCSVSGLLVNQTKSTVITQG
jgi:hypothetical protein